MKARDRTRARAAVPDRRAIAKALEPVTQVLAQAFLHGASLGSERVRKLGRKPGG